MFDEDIVYAAPRALRFLAAAVAMPPRSKIPAAPPGSAFFHCWIIVERTPYAVASSDTVCLPLSAAEAIDRFVSRHVRASQRHGLRPEPGRCQCPQVARPNPFEKSAGAVQHHTFDPDPFARSVRPRRCSGPVPADRCRTPPRQAQGRCEPKARRSARRILSDSQEVAAFQFSSSRFSNRVDRRPRRKMSNV